MRTIYTTNIYIYIFFFCVCVCVCVCVGIVFVMYQNFSRIWSHNYNFFDSLVNTYRTKGSLFFVRNEKFEDKPILGKLFATKPP